MIPYAFPLRLELMKQLFFDFEITFSLVNKYLCSGSNNDKLAFSPILIFVSFIPKICLPLVKISIDFSTLKIELRAPKIDSSPVDPNNEFSKSVFLLSMSIGE